MSKQEKSFYPGMSIIQTLLLEVSERLEEERRKKLRAREKGTPTIILNLTQKDPNTGALDVESHTVFQAD